MNTDKPLENISIEQASLTLISKIKEADIETLIYKILDDSDNPIIAVFTVNDTDLILKIQKVIDSA